MSDKVVTLRDGSQFEYDGIMPIGLAMEHLWIGDTNSKYFNPQRDWIRGIVWKDRRIDHTSAGWQNGRVATVNLFHDDGIHMLTRDDLVYVRFFSLEERIQELRDSYNAVLAMTMSEQPPARADEKSSAPDNPDATRGDN